MDVPRISINANIKANEPRPFLAKITVDELRPGKYENKPWQWVVVAQPLKFVVKGLGFYAYIGISGKEIEEGPKEQTQFGLHMAAFKSVFGQGEAFDIGQGDLIDRYAWFVRKEHLYPVNADGTQFKTQLMIPVKEATDEEIEEAGGTAPVSKNVVLSDAEVEAVLNALEGKSRNQFQKTAFRAKLEPTLLGHIVSGAAIDYLVSNNVAQFTEDDVLVRA